MPDFLEADTVAHCGLRGRAIGAGRGVTESDLKMSAHVRDMSVVEIFRRCLDDIYFYLSEGRETAEIIDIVYPRIVDALQHYEGNELVKSLEDRRTLVLFEAVVLTRERRSEKRIVELYREAMLRGFEEYKNSIGKERA